jgi:Flp pilus assembly protein TadG
VVVEAVLIIPVLMLVLLVIVQFALWAHAAQVVQLAASEGDRVARTAGDSAEAGQARAEAVLAASGSGVTTTSADVSVLSGDQARITVTGRAVAVLPWLDLPVSATEVGPIQEFRTSG